MSRTILCFAVALLSWACSSDPHTDGHTTPLDSPHPTGDGLPSEHPDSQPPCSNRTDRWVIVDLNILCSMLEDENYGCDKSARELLQGYTCTPSTGTEPVDVNWVKRGCGLEEIHLQTPGGIYDRSRTYDVSTGMLVGAVERSDAGWGICNVSSYGAGLHIDSCADTVTMDCERKSSSSAP